MRQVTRGGGVLLVALVCVLSPVASAVGPTAVGTAAGTPTTITSCTTIDTPGEYVLGSSITSTAGSSCIRITASDVILDGQDNTIEDQGGGIEGVHVPRSAGVENLTVRNVQIRNWSTGLTVVNGSDLLVEEVTVRESENGVAVRDTDGVDLRRVTVVGATTNLGVGIDVDGGGEVTLETVDARSFLRGLQIGTPETRVVDAVARNNGRTGIRVTANGTVVRNGRALANGRAGVSVEAPGVRDVRLVNVTARNNRNGINVSGETFFDPVRNRRVSGPALNVTIARSTVENNDVDGISLGTGSSLAPARTSTIRATTVASNGNFGIVFYVGSNGTRILNTTVTSNANIGIVGTSSADLRLETVTSRGNSGFGLDISVSDNVTMVDSRVTDNEGGVSIRDPDGLIVDGLYAANNTRQGIVVTPISRSRVRVRNVSTLSNGDTGAVLTGTTNDRYVNITARNNRLDGFLIALDTTLNARDLRAVSNGRVGIRASRGAQAIIEGATVRDNAAVLELFKSVVTVRDLETAAGTFRKIEMRGGTLTTPAPASYPGKAAAPPVLSVSRSTDYVDFRFEYANDELPPGANESTVRLFNGTNTSAPEPVAALVNRNTNTIAANVTSAPGEPLETGGRVDLVALAEFTPVANVTVTNLQAPVTVTRGERVNLSATVGNDGNVQTTVTPEYRVNGSTVATGGTVTLPGGRSTTVTFNLSGADTQSFPTGTVSHGVFAANASATAALTVAAATTGGPSPLVGSTAPKDPDGDGRYEDIDGEGGFGILDVATFLNTFDQVPDDEIEFFDFNGDGGINIADVAELLGEV